MSKNKNEKYTKLYCVIVATQWILISGLRHASVGADTVSYQYQFEQVKAGRLEKLSYLLKIANEFHVDTYLPEVIAYVNAIRYDNYQQYLCRNIIEKRAKKLF